jgi:hypothetical protein
MSSLVEWARYSVPDDFWPIAIALIIISIASFFAAFYFFHRMRVMSDIPTSKIRSAAQGYLELVGRGELLEGPQIFAPLTGKVSTWYQFMIQERRRTHKKNHWVTIEQGISDELFLIIDDTGKCVIDPEGASVIPSVTDTWYGSSPRPGKSTSSSFLAGRRYRYIEKRMHPGEPLYAIGLYQTVGGASAEFDTNSEVLDLIKEWKNDSEVLLKKYDANQDGQIDMQEWEQVRKAALEVVMQNHRDMKTAPAVNMLARTHDRRRPFILSSIPQEGLINRYRAYSYGLIILFFLAGTIVTWIINLRMNA